MSHFILFTVLLTIIFEPCCVTSTGNGIAVNRTILTKILGGTEVAIKEYPFMVSIQVHAIRNGDNAAGHICGGSLVRADWVLTAAQCLVYEDKDLSNEVKRFMRVRHVERLSVMAGLSEPVLLYVDHPNRRAVLSTHINKYYDPSSITEDIGLMKLVSEYPLTKEIQLAILADGTYYDTLKPTSCTAIGWGLHIRDGRKRRDAGIPEKNMARSNVDSYYRFVGRWPLKFVVLNTIANQECRELMGSFWTRRHVSKVYQICVESTETKGAVWGDAGSALMCGGIQVGMSSHGDRRKEADHYLPSIYTRTDYYLDWINTTISTAYALQTSHGSWWMNYAMVLALAVALKQI